MAIGDALRHACFESSEQDISRLIELGQRRML